ncbi:MAG: hypothetical protein ACON38_13455 [Akkermansiaceae bacterium]
MIHPVLAAYWPSVAEWFLLIGLAISILWLAIGWRAMKAHEQLATEARRANDRLVNLDLVDVRGELRSQSKAYREFVRSHPEVEQLSSKERHERFRQWESEQDSGRS